ncbi:MAG: hypothetical protein ABEI06_03255, partial [Halobacteriaceae archaeon]
MSPHITSTVVVLKTLTLVLGGLITYFAYKAYRRSQSRPLQFLTIGFGFVTIGALLAGLVDQFGNTDPTAALIIEGIFT